MPEQTPRRRGRPKSANTTVVGVRVSNEALDRHCKRALRAGVPVRSVLRRALEGEIHNIPERPLPEHDPTDVVDVAIAYLIRDNQTCTPDDLRALLKRRAEWRSYTADYWERRNVAAIAAEQARIQERIQRLTEEKRLLARIKQRKSAASRTQIANERARRINQRVRAGANPTEAIERELREQDPAFDAQSKEKRWAQIQSVKRDLRRPSRRGL